MTIATNPLCNAFMERMKWIKKEHDVIGSRKVQSSPNCYDTEYRRIQEFKGINMITIFWKSDKPFGLENQSA